ncbi:MAG: hypothetical protein OXH66_08865 [Gemmatimonadetes bacterium]|nr:hypothetical protein [Gemmatimonadota bacterium]
MGFVAFLVILGAVVTLVLVVSGDTERSRRRVVFKRPVTVETVRPDPSGAPPGTPDSTDAQILAAELGKGCDGNVTFTKVLGSWYMEVPGSETAYPVKAVMPEYVTESLDRWSVRNTITMKRLLAVTGGC